MTPPEVPTPRFVAAWLRLEVLVDPGRIPLWAAHWLADGLDTEAVRDLAGLDSRDPIEARDAAARALDELGVSTQRLDEAARIVLTDAAESCLSGHVTERELAAVVESLYVQSGYADEILRQPLGATYGTDDEWTGGWGRTDEQLRDAIRSACDAQLRVRS